MPHGAARRGLTVEPDRHQQQRSGQDAGQLGGEVGQAQAVLKHGDGEEPEQRAGHAAPAAEDRRAAEHDRRDRRQLVAGAGVGLGLAQVSHVDDRRQAGDQSREQVNQRRRAARPAGRRTALPRARSRSRPSPRPIVVRCSKTQNAAATTTKIGTWAGTPPSE